ncbi:hypothetical protein AVEN_109627-1, partial [Araneus ventricosus]
MLFRQLEGSGIKNGIPLAGKKLRHDRACQNKQC